MSAEGEQTEADLRRFYAEGVCRAGKCVTLGPDPSRHLAVVLRIGEGELVRVFTGEGEEYVACVEDAEPGAVRVRILRPCRAQEAPPARLVLGVAPPPGQRADMLVEKATELGVSALRPLLCDRVQGHRARGAARRRERWLRKAREAARQCGRTDVPRVFGLLPFDRFLRDESEGLRLVACTDAAAPVWDVLSRQPERPAAVTMAVGPAGGFTRREREAAAEAGFVPVSLGRNVLRVETAAVCLLAAVTLYLDGAEAAVG